LNVEGEDLIGIPVKKAKEFISAAMARWSVGVFRISKTGFIPSLLEGYLIF